MSGKAIRETLAALGVIASMVFVGWEIRQNTIASRAEAVQEIGVATAQMWGEIARDRRLARLTLLRSEESLAALTEDDWLQINAQMIAWLRLAETTYLQTQQGLLPESSLDMLGYGNVPGWLRSPVFACLWGDLRPRLGSRFADFVEGGLDRSSTDCSRFAIPDENR